MHISIRKAVAEDTEILVELYTEVTADLEKRSIFQWENSWSENFFLNNLGNIYVLEIDEKIIGSFIIREIGSNQQYANASGFYLEKIVISPVSQGKNFAAHIFKNEYPISSASICNQNVCLL